VQWKWIEENVATLVKNPEPRAGETHPFDSWEQVDAIAAELGDTDAPLVILMAGTGVRPEEAFAVDWRDVALERRVFRVRRAFAKGRLKECGKTTGSRRAVPLRARVVDAIESLERRRGLVFPAPAGGHIDINNWRRRQWTPALAAAGVEHRRIYEYADVLVMPTLARRSCSERRRVLVVRHNQSASRKARSVSEGRWRPGLAAIGLVRSIACCLWVMSACR
jgi:integrase